VLKRCRTPETAADVLRAYVYGDVPLDEWPSKDGGQTGGVWDEFSRAKELVHQGHTDQAADVWQQISLTTGLDPRQLLQAWYFLRQVGRRPPVELAKTVLGAVLEMPVQGKHDLLAGYSDDSVRYLNYAGSALVVEDPSIAGLHDALDAWLEVSRLIVGVIGPWDQPSFPPLPQDHARLVVLTPSGPHFGQGPRDAMQADRAAGAFIGAAMRVMTLVTSASRGSRGVLHHPSRGGVAATVPMRPGRSHPAARLASYRAPWPGGGR
jgi:hypothetical protein